MDFTLPKDLEGLDPTRRVGETYPGRVLVIHVLEKGLQGGSVLGVALTPVVAWWWKAPLSSTWRAAMPSSTVLFTSMSLALLLQKGFVAHDLTPEHVDDRAYRLSKNEGQLAVDQYGRLGGALGAAAGAVLGGFSLRTITACGLTGVAAGVATFGAARFVKGREAE